MFPSSECVINYSNGRKICVIMRKEKCGNRHACVCQKKFLCVAGNASPGAVTWLLLRLRQVGESPETAIGEAACLRPWPVSKV